MSVIWVWRGWGIELERESTINTGAGGSFTDRWLLQRLSVNGQPAP
ncbi:MAG: hypothetical protein HY855_13965 [Burkholderiales bacterium]|nr:hypothetical protein [Burkholderiales bacterium]